MNLAPRKNMPSPLTNQQKGNAAFLNRKCVFLLAVFLSAPLLSACNQNTIKSDTTNLAIEDAQPSQTPADQIEALLEAEFTLQREGPNKAFEPFYELAKTSRDVTLVSRLTKIAVAAQNNEYIEQSSDLWLSIEPSSEQAYSLKIQVLTNGQRDSDVATTLMNAIDHNASLRFLPLYLEDNIRDGDKVKTIENAIAALPIEYQHDQYIQLSHAHILLLAGQYESAIQLSEQLFTRADTDKSEALHLILAFSQKNIGALEDAISTLFSAANVFPKNTRIIIPLIDFLVENDNVEKAVNVYQEANFETEEQLQVGINAMRTLLEHKQPKYALAIAMSLPKNQLGLANQVKYLTAISLADLGDKADAIKIMNQVDGNLRSRATRHLVLWLYDENQEAIINDVVLSRTLRKNLPEQAILTGQYHEDRGNLALSYDLVARSSDALPESNALRYRKALLAEALDDWQTTETELKILLQKEADNPQYLNALGYTLLTRTKRIDEAMSYIESAYEKAEDDPAIIDSLGWGHFLKGELEQASYFLKKAWTMLQNAEIAAHYGESLWKQRHYKQATKIWEMALESQPDSPLLLETINRLSPSLLDQQRNETRQDDIS